MRKPHVLDRRLTGRNQNGSQDHREAGRFSLKPILARVQRHERVSSESVANGFTTRGIRTAQEPDCGIGDGSSLRIG